MAARDEDISKALGAGGNSSGLSQGNPLNSVPFTNTRQQYKLFTRSEIYSEKDTSIFNSFYRYGMFNTYGSVLSAKEYVFFTKPDLAIYTRDENTGMVNKSLPELNKGLTNEFWYNLHTYNKEVIGCLQSSYNNNPFNYLLQNSMTGNLSVPSLTAPTIESATNMYGVSLSYRGSSEGSDDNPDFSLEFKDDKFLNVYSFFKAYEEYETAKHHGIISPYIEYVYNKIIHDQFAVYKFIVDEDLRTILYYGKYYGVMPTSLPRESFSTDDFTNGITYSVDFKAGFYDDMKPRILYEFNKLARPVISELDLRRLSPYVDSSGKTNAYAVDKSASVYKNYNKSGQLIYDYERGGTKYAIRGDGDGNTTYQGMTVNNNELPDTIVNPKPAIIALVSEHDLNTDPNDPSVLAHPHHHIYRLNWFGK